MRRVGETLSRTAHHTLEPILPKLRRLDQIFSSTRQIIQANRNGVTNSAMRSDAFRHQGSQRLALLVLSFLEAIIVDSTVPVSQLFATKGHEVDLMSRCTLQDERKRILWNCKKSQYREILP